MSVAKGFRLSDDSTASLDWNYVTNSTGSKTIIEEVNDVKTDFDEVDIHFANTNLTAGFIDGGVNSSKVVGSPKYLSVYFPVVVGKTYTIYKGYATAYCRIGYTSTVPQIDMEVSNYTNLGGNTTYKTFVAVQSGYVCSFIYNDSYTSATRAQMKAATKVYEGDYNSAFVNEVNLVDIANVDKMAGEISNLITHFPPFSLIAGIVYGSFSSSALTIATNSGYLIVYFPVTKGNTYTIDKKQLTSCFRTAFSSGIPAVGTTLTNYSSGPANKTYETFVAPYTGYASVLISASSAEHSTLLSNVVAYEGGYNSDITQSMFRLANVTSMTGNVFYCGATRELSTLKAGIEKATSYMDSVLYVDAGVYDLVDEFGDDYFENLTSASERSGLQLKNRVHIVFSPNSKVISHYTGDNQYAQSLYSPFNCYDYGFTIENLTLECSRCRYAIHDERNGGTEQCQSKYLNCKITFDNSENDYWRSEYIIGGGLGSNHEVVIDGCYFIGTNPDIGGHSVYYHQSNSLSNPNFRNYIRVNNCYFSIGIMQISVSRTDGTENTTFMICNNSFPVSSYADGVRKDIAEGAKVEVITFNNEIRT